MIRAVIESPYAGETAADVEANVAYARAAMADAFKLGYAPFASHLLYTQPGVLDDKVPHERALGIKAGFEWREAAGLTIVYVDRGISRGMWAGIFDSNSRGVPVMWRSLQGNQHLVEAAVDEFVTKVAKKEP